MKKLVYIILVLTFLLIVVKPVSAASTAIFSTTVSDHTAVATFFPVVLDAPGVTTTVYNGTTVTETIVNTTYSSLFAAFNSMTTKYIYTKNESTVSFYFEIYYTTSLVFDWYVDTFVRVPSKVKYFSAISYPNGGTSTVVILSSTWSTYSSYIYNYGVFTNQYGYSTSIYITINDGPNWSEATSITATFDEYDSYTSLNISLSNHIFTIDYTLNGTKTYEYFAGPFSLTLINGDSTAIAAGDFRNGRTITVIEPSETITVTDAFRDSIKMEYNSTEISIFSNTVIIGSKTLIFSTTTSTELFNKMAIILFTDVRSLSSQTEPLFFVVRTSYPSFIISSYSANGNTIYVDGTIVYPLPLFVGINVMAVAEEAAPINFLFPEDIVNGTYSPIGGYITLVKIYLSGTPGPTTSTQNSTSNTTTTTNIIVTRKAGGKIITSIHEYLTYGNASLVIENDTISINPDSVTLTNTILGGAVLFFSNKSLVSSKSTVITRPLTTTNNGVKVATFTAGRYTVGIALVDTLSENPGIIKNFTGDGTYTGEITSKITAIDYFEGTIYYIVYDAVISYTITVTSFTPQALSTSESTTKILGMNITTKPGEGVEGIVTRFIITILWLIEALLFLLLLYYSYRYATTEDPDERKKYEKRLLYVFVAMLIIYGLPTALDWLVGI